MNYREKHSHKWARILKEARRRAKLVNELHAAGKVAEAKAEFQLLYGGDFRDPSPEKLFPGLKLMAPYWKAVEGEMECRFDCMLEFSGDLRKIADEKEFKDNTDRFYRLFLDDARSLLERDQLLDYGKVQKYFDGGIRAMHLPDDWPQALKPMKDRFEADLAKGRVDMDLLDDWHTFCVRGVIAYDYSLIRQALFVSTVLGRHGEQALTEVFNKSRDEFGWRVSRLFFVDILPKAGIEGADLMRMGLYSMGCDQDFVREGASSMGGDAPTTPQTKLTKFLNCQEYSVFATVAEHLKLPLKKIGVGICVYCEEHARKNANLFTPPSMKPVLKMEKALGLEDDMCVCRTVLNPADDMERFMQAQDKVFYYEGNK